MLPAAGKPVIIIPGKLLGIPDDRGILGRVLKESAKRFGLEGDVAMEISDFIFLMSAFWDAWDKNFPDARRPKRAHLMAAPIPAVEVSHDTDPLGVGSPDGKACACDAINGVKVRPE